MAIKIKPPQATLSTTSPSGKHLDNMLKTSFISTFKQKMTKLSITDPVSNTSNVATESPSMNCDKVYTVSNTHSMSKDIPSVPASDEVTKPIREEDNVNYDNVSTSIEAGESEGSITNSNRVNTRDTPTDTKKKSRFKIPSLGKVCSYVLC